MAKRQEWVKAVTPDIRKNMETSAHAAYTNGCNLRDDAILLYEANRYARAAALAILSEEEFSKAFILLICANDGRWDSNIYKALRTHAQKQGISEAMTIYVKWFKESSQRVLEMNRISLIANQPSIYPTEEKWEEILSTARSRFSKPILDHFKQDAMYISFDEEGCLQSVPNSVTKLDAQQYLENARQFQQVTEQLLGTPNAAR